MADGNVTVQGIQARFGEYLGDQAHVLVDHDVRAVAYRDAGRFLTAVLQRVQAEVGELGDFLTRGPHPENPAGILRSTLPGERFVR